MLIQQKNTEINRISAELRVRIQQKDIELQQKEEEVRQKDTEYRRSQDIIVSALLARIHWREYATF